MDELFINNLPESVLNIGINTERKERIVKKVSKDERRERRLLTSRPIIINEEGLESVDPMIIPMCNINPQNKNSKGFFLNN